jgi:nucleotide-binding universal stress UspA family protein
MPLNPKKILVGTDFSPSAREAADAAGLLARAFDGHVTLLHVVPMSLYATAATHLEGKTFSTRDLRAEVAESVAKDADAELLRLKEQGIDASFRTVDGPPPAEIARVAAEDHYDLVVISTHGRTGLRHLAMGSVAENVVRLCHAPVLVMRSAASAQP